MSIEMRDPTASALNRAGHAGAVGQARPQAAQAEQHSTGPQAVNGRFKSFFSGIAGQLLLYTAGFVLLAQLLIYPVSITAFRATWLTGRASASELASLGAQSMPGGHVNSEFSRVFLERAFIISIVGQANGHPFQILAPARPIDGQVVPIQLPSGSLLEIPDALTQLISSGRNYYQMAYVPRLTNFDTMVIVVPQAPLKAAMWNASGTILLTSFGFSALVGALVYLFVFRFVVRPIQGLTVAVTRFSESPEAVTILPPAGSGNEIGRIGTALGEMQSAVASAFRQRKHLADLGEAVAKICHDLRNSLSAAQVLSDGLGHSRDPEVQDAAPRLVRAIERSITLAESTLRYGRTETPLPDLEPVRLRAALNEAVTEALTSFSHISGNVICPEDIVVLSDPDHLHRIVTNLVRNAAAAVKRRYGAADGGKIEAEVERKGEQVLVKLADNGPGIPPTALARLFKPFSKVGGDGGAGLGLAIARELARDMGGDLQLKETNPSGATFALSLKIAALQS